VTPPPKVCVFAGLTPEVGRRLACVALLVALAAASPLTACHGDRTPHLAYQCPMECEGDQRYDQPGQCPICAMDLVEVGP